jgi:hypothetical protein
MHLPAAGSQSIPGAQSSSVLQMSTGGHPPVARQSAAPESESTFTDILLEQPVGASRARNPAKRTVSHDDRRFDDIFFAPANLAADIRAGADECLACRILSEAAKKQQHLSYEKQACSDSGKNGRLFIGAQRG